MSRPFLPPSHYAAAAGIMYDGNKHIADITKGSLSDLNTRAFISAYPYDAEPDSQSSFEFKVMEDKPSVPPKSTRRSRRDSLLNDLPQLEANLLPSLRDTIDRMTKSPSQPEPSGTSHLSIPRLSGASRASRSLSPLCVSREKRIAKSVTPEPPTRRPSSPADVLTPRTNTPAKTPRSTLRPPAPKLQLKASSDSPPSTLRSILKKMPKNDATPPPISEGDLNRRPTVSNVWKPANRPIRSRSRTDPGILPTTTSSESNPTTSDFIEKPNTQITPRLQPSGIPRLQSRHTGAGNWWSTDESDVDGQEKPRGRDRRQLIVPRGVSQSNLETEDEKRKGTRGGVRRDPPDGSQLVGLGIGLGSEREKKKIKGNDSRQTSTPPHPDISLRSTRRVTGDRTMVQQDSSAFDPPSVHKRRREALRDIVSNLHLDVNPTEGESDYEGEEGAAISGSQNLAEFAQRGDVDVDSAQEYKETRALSSSSNRRLRPRSTSHTPTPTFLVSPNPDGISTTRLRTPLLKTCQPGPSRTPTLKAQAQCETSSRSRSPIIPQTDTPATSTAARRHSVYHRSASPGALTHKIGDNSIREEKKTSVDRRGSGAGLLKGQRGSGQQRREGVSVNDNETVSKHAYEDRRHTLPHAESDLSSIGSMYWGDDSESELSPAAETLFQKLGQGRADRKASVDRGLRASVVFKTPSPWTSEHDRRPRPRLVSPPPPPEAESPNEAGAETTETRRQDVIMEICECEEAFVKRLQVFVELFILPLRAQDTKAWIVGVPTEIARLLDWLEDIVVLHTQISAALAAVRDAQYPAVQQVAEAMRVFVPRLEVYQPYLVNLECVVGIVEEMVGSGESEFGEFVRLREKENECEGWNFQRFLIEPVNLLARLPGLFNRLLELTPKSHRDYMPTLGLTRSTEMLIRVMTEVKLREDEYDLIQHFAARIRGLVSSSSSRHLATRERRLLHHGTMHLVDVEANDLPGGVGTGALFRYLPPGVNAGGAIAQRGTRAGSGSGSGSTSSSGASSVFFSSLRMPFLKRGRGGGRRVMSPSPIPAPRDGARGTPVRVWVFSDLLVLASIASEEGEEEEDMWTLLNHIGTTRVLDVRYPQEGDQDENEVPVDEHEVITIEVFAVDTKRVNQTLDRDLDKSSVFVLRLDVPAQTDEEEDVDEERRRWVAAFVRAQRMTVCALSTPGQYSGDHALCDGMHLDATVDTHEALRTLVASGLPMPKSPSMILCAGGAGAGAGGEVQRKEEREERGWWAMRFRRVLREVVRREGDYW
ncbi:hypothetical protein C0992_004450 [Termitomyces sp. T32_za158]|nr:hypothetical protein C0992_004450 [Termitomyces sp. T32_za158]